MSTTLCTGGVKNIFSRYMHENSVVYACFLDPSKAFDLVNHKILFERLFDRNFPAYLTRFFYHGTRSSACVLGGETFYLTVFLSQMVSGKAVYFLQFPILMTS